MKYKALYRCKEQAAAVIAKCGLVSVTRRPYAQFTVKSWTVTGELG